ncbi:hypothetical protein PTSG_06739 [Salpingoeca rosetta]|uniref:Histone-lysine N-methyltransferase, H3 lysine-79 specific n=1 Tax=Salpingoeca rosetta (strain ATCC 50818 / BSB-021) TaxID=946362 RepID=F2UEN3_SALR5|nr:uncharacterized protein PTSG_06739 [Salpingoeca rosetta]EGD75083.1 hypothetical protein PTSG_06739 [Salpingoeca rosetta]|eukprot:XP_004992136.1 hypothetical protein PTSG_06739 [Salpingoeca rosetta]
MVVGGGGSLHVLEAVYERVDGYAVAREERTRLRKAGQFEKTEALQYGEIDFAGFLNVLEAAEPREGDKFVDIGSGTGKAVLLAAGQYQLGSAVGVEIVKPLHELATEAKERFYSQCPDAPTPSNKCSVVLGDSFALTNLWLDADILYCPCTCFTEEMMAALTAQMKHLRPGTRVISTSRPLEVPCLSLTTTLRAKYKRGTLQFYIYTRNAQAAAAAATTTDTEAATDVHKTGAKHDGDGHNSSKMKQDKRAKSANNKGNGTGVKQPTNQPHSQHATRQQQQQPGEGKGGKRAGKKHKNKKGKRGKRQQQEQGSEKRSKMM